VSSESSCAVRLARHSQNAWARHVECVESSRVEPSGIWALLRYPPPEDFRDAFCVAGVALYASERFYTSCFAQSMTLQSGGHSECHKARFRRDSITSRVMKLALWSQYNLAVWSNHWQYAIKRFLCYICGRRNAEEWSAVHYDASQKQTSLRLFVLCCCTELWTCGGWKCANPLTVYWYRRWLQ